jgi:formylglycine-generating enzyme required for sulfatase activity
VDVGAVLVGRYPVTNAQLGGGVEASGEGVAFDVARRARDPQLAGHPATGLTFAEAEAFCAWGRSVTSHASAQSIGGCRPPVTLDRFAVRA